MKRNRSLSACPTAQESVAGGVYFIFQLVLLPSILRWVNAQLSQPELYLLSYQFSGDNSDLP